MPLVEPFVTSFGKTTDRRVLLAEIQAEGLVGWGECVAGEHPYFSGGVDRYRVGSATAGAGSDACVQRSRTWRRLPQRFSRRCAATPWRRPRSRTPSGTSKRRSRRRRCTSCWAGRKSGLRAVYPSACNPPWSSNWARLEREVDAGYQRIKLKCQPGWDVEMLEAVRKRGRRSC